MRLIYADALVDDLGNELDAARRLGLEGQEEGLQIAIIALGQAPVIDAVPIRNGVWIKDTSYPIYDDGRFDGYYNVCSMCGFAIEDKHGLYNYCPNCGSRMDGGDVSAKNKAD